MSDDRFTGGCHCGRTKFTTTSAPKFVARCHCDSCRRTTGGAFSTWVGFDTSAVTWESSLPTYYTSTVGIKRGFCDKCGTPLTYEGSAWPGETHLLIGVIENNQSLTPTGDAFPDEALTWCQPKSEGMTK